MAQTAVQPQKPKLLQTLLIAWLVANFALPGLAALLVGGWYLRWPTLPGMAAELGLIMLPNLALPILVLRRWFHVPIRSIPMELGWQWNGWRSVIVGLGFFALSFPLNAIVVSRFGASIPYNLPGQPAPFQPQGIVEVFGVLALLLLFLVLTVAGEETMFRGFLQTQLGDRFGPWSGLLLAALLFGLRHLPADLFYAQVWDASPQMWAARLAQLYLTALLLGGARLVGRSTWASAIFHGLILLQAFFGLG